MKKFLKVYGVFIAITAILTVIFSLFSMGLQIYPSLSKVSLSLESMYLLIYLIQIPFLITEMKNGIGILKKTKNNDVTGCLKPILGLSNSIINAQISVSMVSLIIKVVGLVSGGGEIDTFNLIYIGVSLFFYVFSKAMTSFLKRNVYRPLAIFNIFFIIFAMIYLPFTSFYSLDKSGIVNLISSLLIVIGNVLIIILIFIYSIFALIYYKKYRYEIDKEFDENSEFKVLKTYKNGTQLIKAYQEKPSKGSWFVYLCLFSGIALYFAFMIIVFIQTFKTNSLLSFLDFEASFSSIITISDALVCLSMILSIPMVLGLILDLLRHNSSGYAMLPYFTVISRYYLYKSIIASVSSGTFLSLITSGGIASIFDSPEKAMGLVGNVLLIPTFVCLALGKNNYNKINDTLKNGDSFLSDQGHASKAIIFYTLASLCTIVMYIITSLLNGIALNYVFVIYILFNIVFTIGVVLNKKHNIEESYIAIRNPKKAETKKEEKDKATEPSLADYI